MLTLATPAGAVHVELPGVSKTQSQAPEAMRVVPHVPPVDAHRDSVKRVAASTGPAESGPAESGPAESGLSASAALSGVSSWASAMGEPSAAAASCPPASVEASCPESSVRASSVGRASNPASAVEASSVGASAGATSCVSVLSWTLASTLAPVPTSPRPHPARRAAHGSTQDPERRLMVQA
jgi:hypothetical protein